jgi:hypothetical protein
MATNKAKIELILSEMQFSIDSVIDLCADEQKDYGIWKVFEDEYNTLLSMLADYSPVLHKCFVDYGDFSAHVNRFSNETQISLNQDGKHY